ncbi:hypothetical protein CapIbe_002009 [Capra ibex]
MSPGDGFIFLLSPLRGTESGSKDRGNKILPEDFRKSFLGKKYVLKPKGRAGMSQTRMKREDATLIELRSTQSQWEEAGESVPQTVGHSSPFADKPWKAPGSTTSVGEQHTTMPLGLMTWATWPADTYASQSLYLPFLHPFHPPD